MFHGSYPMSMQTVEFTVTAIIDGTTTAVLTTSDFREARIPTFCLPNDAAVGSIVTLTIAKNDEKDREKLLKVRFKDREGLLCLY